jgi:hypothetical protein
MPAPFQVGALLRQIARLDGHMVKAGASRLENVAPGAFGPGSMISMAIARVQ